MKTDKIKGAMISAGYSTMEHGAKSIGMPYTTFCKKMKDGSFNIKEAISMIKAWDIKRPTEIFFGDCVN